MTLSKKCNIINCEIHTHCPFCNSNLVNHEAFVDDAYCKSCKKWFKDSDYNIRGKMS